MENLKRKIQSVSLFDPLTSAPRPLTMLLVNENLDYNLEKMWTKTRRQSLPSSLFHSSFFFLPVLSTCSACSTLAASLSAACIIKQHLLEARKGSVKGTETKPSAVNTLFPWCLNTADGKHRQTCWIYTYVMCISLSLFCVSSQQEEDGGRRNKQRTSQFGYAELPGYTALDAVGLVCLFKMASVHEGIRVDQSEHLSGVTSFHCHKKHNQQWQAGLTLHLMNLN